MSEQKEPKKISGSLKKFFGVGDFGFTLMSNIDTFYASYFFTNIAKFSTGIVAVMTTISAVVDAILSMMYGAFTVSYTHLVFKRHFGVAPSKYRTEHAEEAGT